MAKKTEKYVHKGFSWNLRGPIDQKAKSFVLTAPGEITLKLTRCSANKKAQSLIGRSWQWA